MSFTLVGKTVTEGPEPESGPGQMEFTHLVSTGNLREVFSHSQLHGAEPTKTQ